MKLYKLEYFYIPAEELKSLPITVIPKHVTYTTF